MTARVAFILCGSLLQLMFLCSAVPLQKRTVGPGETVMQIPPRFDAGPVNSCEIPATNFCSGIDYLVPTSVARLAPIIEEEIRRQYDMEGGLIPECATAVRDVQCAQRFPRCSEDGAQVTLSSLNCTDRISVCSDSERMILEAEGFCTLDGTSLTDECRPMTDHDYQFQSCTASSDWRVTRWMYDIMVHTDLQVTHRFSGLLGVGVDVQCRQKYADFVCRFMGRCTSEEEPRVELVNTYELCEEVLNCYPDQTAAYLRSLLPCDLWPSRFDIDIPSLPTQPVVIERTTSTESPTSSNSDPPAATTTAAGATWPTPRMTVNVLVGGTPSIHSVGPLLLLTIAILGALWT